MSKAQQTALMDKAFVPLGTLLRPILTLMIVSSVIEESNQSRSEGVGAVIGRASKRQKSELDDEASKVSSTAARTKKSKKSTKDKGTGTGKVNSSYKLLVHAPHFPLGELILMRLSIARTKVESGGLVTEVSKYQSKYVREFHKLLLAAVSMLKIEAGYKERLVAELKEEESADQVLCKATENWIQNKTACLGERLAKFIPRDLAYLLGWNQDFTRFQCLMNFLPAFIADDEDAHFLPVDMVGTLSHNHTPTDSDGDEDLPTTQAGLDGESAISPSLQSDDMDGASALSGATSVSVSPSMHLEGCVIRFKSAMPTLPWMECTLSDPLELWMAMMYLALSTLHSLMNTPFERNLLQQVSFWEKLKIGVTYSGDVFGNEIYVKNRIIIVLKRMVNGQASPKMVCDAIYNNSHMISFVWAMILLAVRNLHRSRSSEIDEDDDRPESKGRLGRDLEDPELKFAKHSYSWAAIQWRIHPFVEYQMKAMQKITTVVDSVNGEFKSILDIVVPGDITSESEAESDGENIEKEVCIGDVEQEGV